MHALKAQLDAGEVTAVNFSIKAIIEEEGRQIHLTVSSEGLVVDVIVADEVVATSCYDLETLEQQAMIPG